MCSLRNFLKQNNFDFGKNYITEYILLNIKKLTDVVLSFKTTSTLHKSLF
jgi:hypothetical protein